MTAAPFSAMMLFVVTVIADQELYDSEPVFLLPFRKQFVEKVVVVFDAGDAVVLKVNNVVFITDPCHKSFRIIPVGGTGNGSLNAEALQLGFRGLRRRGAYCLA